MDKTIITITAILLTVVGSVSGVLGNQLSSVQGEVNDHAKIVYIIPEIKEDIKDIKIEVNQINDKLDMIALNRAQTKP